MKILRSIAVVLLFAVGSALGAGRNEIPARVALKDQSGAVDVILTGRRNGTVYARLQDATSGRITFRADDIKRIAVSLPGEQLLQAEALIRAGRGEEGLKIIRAIARPVVAYLDLPVDGAVEPALRYAAAARTMEAWSEAIQIYTALEENPDERVSRQAAGWLAYSHMKNMQPKKAAEWLERFDSNDPRDPGFIPASVAGALHHEAEQRNEAALDLAARAASLAKIDHELYAEALFVSARSYEALSRVEVESSANAGDVVHDSGAPPLAAPMLPGEFLAVATNQYARLVGLFPRSPFAAAASNSLAKIEAELAAESEDVKPTGTGEEP